jgi:[ribosomal protein S5]-alanine N-acetyltransferase
MPAIFEQSTISLTTDRFLLRRLRDEDVTEVYVGWLNDPEINRFLEVRWRTQTLDSVRQYVASHDNQDGFVFGIFTRPEGRHIGNYSLKVDANNRVATLGVIIGDQDYWGQAVVLETRARVLDFVFAELAVDKVSGGCYQTNTHAIFNYKRQGWQLDGIRKSDRIDGERRVDVVNFAMFKEQWLNRDDG